MEQAQQRKYLSYFLLALPFLWAIIFKIIVKTAVISFDLTQRSILLQWILVMLSWFTGIYLLIAKKELTSTV